MNLYGFMYAWSHFGKKKMHDLAALNNNFKHIFFFHFIKNIVSQKSGFNRTFHPISFHTETPTDCILAPHSLYPNTPIVCTPQKNLFQSLNCTPQKFYSRALIVFILAPAKFSFDILGINAQN